MYDPKKHHRRSIRLKGYDYSRPGFYFVTICTQNQTRLFGHVKDAEMVLNAFGEIVAKKWQWLAEQYDYVQLDEWCVMPNHLHGIIEINDGRIRRGSSRTTPADNIGDISIESGGSRTTPTDNIGDNPTEFGDAQNTPANVKCKSVGRLVGAFKTVSTKHINEMTNAPGAKIWQRNYYEHIIRNENDLRRIQKYIFENPVKWSEDKFNIPHGNEN